MKKEDIKRSFENIEPSNADVERMLNRVLDFYEDASQQKNTDQNMKVVSRLKFNFRKYNFRKAVPVFAAALVIAGSILIYNLSTNPWNTVSPENDDRVAELGDIASDSLASGEGSRDMAALVQNQFELGNRHYIILSEEQKSGFNLPEKISEDDIGYKIATITDSVDESLKGLEVYNYKPAGCEAVVALKKGEEYVLFKFLNFESYMKNQDEDAVEYLKLYGIETAADISKIQFIGHSEQAKLENRKDIRSEITDSKKINEFYSYFSALKNSSDNYFKALGSYNNYDMGDQPTTRDPKEAPDYMAPDYPATGGREPVYGGGSSVPGYEGGVEIDLPADAPVPDKDEYAEDSVIAPEAAVDIAVYSGQYTGAGSDPDAQVSSKTAEARGGVGNASSSEGRSGTGVNALGNSATIRIYNSKGIYFETMFYPNIGFISRYEVKGAFLDLLNSYCR